MRPSEVPSWIATASESGEGLSSSMAIARDLIAECSTDVKTETDSWTNDDWSGDGVEGAVGLSDALHRLATNITDELEDGIEVADNYAELMCENSGNIDSWVAEWNAWNGREPEASQPDPVETQHYQEYMIGQFVDQAVANDQELSLRMAAVMASLEESDALLEERINASMSIEDLVQVAVTVYDLDALVDAANDVNYNNPDWHEVDPENVEETVEYLVERGVITQEEANHPSMQQFVVWRLGLGTHGHLIGDGIVAGEITLDEDGSFTYNTEEGSVWDPIALAVVESVLDDALESFDWEDEDIPPGMTEIERREYILRTYLEDEWDIADGDILGSQLDRLLDGAESGEISDADLVAYSVILHALAADELEVDPDYTGSAAVFEKVFAWSGIPASILVRIGKSLRDAPPVISRIGTIMLGAGYFVKGGSFLFDRYVLPHDPDLPNQEGIPEPWEELENPEMPPPDDSDDYLPDEPPPPPDEPSPPVNAIPDYPEPTVPEPGHSPPEPAEPPEEQGPPPAHPTLPPPDPETPEGHYELNPIEEIDCGEDDCDCADDDQQS